MTTIKYSQYDLLSKELEYLEESNPFIRTIQSLFKPKSFVFQVSVPNDLYLRAETLCDDISQLHPENKTYTQNELINHTFDSFIDQVRNHDSNVGSIYNRLVVRNRQILVVNDVPLFPAKSRTTISTKIPRELVYRAEILLKDFSVYEPRHSFQVEHLIEIVYLDFLLEYTNGRRNNVIREIVDSLDDDF